LHLIVDIKPDQCFYLSSEKNRKEMANKTAIITGASSGLYLPSISPFRKKKSQDG